jgi:phosphatidate cytidylyltransferase
MSNAIKRILSAVILAPIVLATVIHGGVPFFICTIILFFATLYEWVSITKKSKLKYLWFLFGFFYLLIACTTLVLLERYRIKVFELNIPFFLLTLLFIIWFTDIFAYIFGKNIGGWKLAPKISPNKTWAGFFGGLFGASLVFFAINFKFPFHDSQYYQNLFFFISISLISMVGDLFESWIKRHFGVKDSGNIIPGHGGLLDRLDGLILVLNVIGVYIYIQSFEVINNAVIGN